MKSKQADAMKRTVYVRGIDGASTTEDELKDFFVPYGKVGNIYFDKEKGLFALVEFETEESATNVLKQKETFIFKGKHLKLKPKTQPKEKAVTSERCLSPDGTSSSVSKRKRRSSDPRWDFFTDGLLLELTTSLNVEEQVNSLIKHLQLTENDVQLRSLICELLTGIFVEFFPSSKVVPFGSSANGLGWRGCDLDICLVTNNDLDQPVGQEENGSSKADIGLDNKDYQLVLKVIRTLVPGCSHVVPVFTAKCPVIKFVIQTSGISCDLTFNNRLGIENTNLLKCYLALDPRVKQLIFTVRAWASAVGVSKTGGGQFTNYALTLMAIYFLQMTNPPVIPSLQSMASEAGYVSSFDNKRHEEPLIEGWDCSYTKDVKGRFPSSNNATIEQLLIEFFQFYGTAFDFGDCAVNIRSGKRCTKVSLQEEIEEIKRAHPTPAYTMGFKLTACCVQDPFELTHNVTQNIGTVTLREVIQQMLEASNMCREFAKRLPEEPSTAKGIIGLLEGPLKAKQKRQKTDHLSFDVPLYCIKGLVPNHWTTPAGHFLFNHILKFLNDDLNVQCEVESVEPLAHPKDETKDGTRKPTVLANDEVVASHCDVTVSPFVATCTAWNDTWTHSRRQRRSHLTSLDKTKEQGIGTEEFPRTAPDKTKEQYSGTLPDKTEEQDSGNEEFPRTSPDKTKEQGTGTREFPRTSPDKTKEQGTGTEEFPRTSPDKTKEQGTGTREFPRTSPDKTGEQDSGTREIPLLSTSTVQTVRPDSANKLPSLVFKLVCDEHVDEKRVSITIIHVSSQGFYTLSNFYAFFKKKVMSWLA